MSISEQKVHVHVRPGASLALTAGVPAGQKDLRKQRKLGEIK